MRTRKIPIRVYKRAYYGKLNESPHLLDLLKDGTVRLPTVTISFKNVADNKKLKITKSPKIKNYGIGSATLSGFELLEQEFNKKHYGFWQNLKYHIGKKLRRVK